MNIPLTSDLQTALKELAQRDGVSPEELALNTLRERFLGGNSENAIADNWQQTLRAAATDCGVSLSHVALSCEGLYE